MSIIWTLVIGLLAGALAKLVMPGRQGGGILVTMLLGIAGALLAGFAGRAFGWYHSPGAGPGLLASTLGALVVLSVYALIPPRPSDAADALTSLDNPQETVIENVRAIAALYERSEREVTRHQRALELIAALAARPLTLYLVGGLTVGWVVLNSILLPRRDFVLDPPPFFWLQGLMGLVAVLLAITVVATQRRQASQAEQRAHLDLQVNLMAEQKIAKVIALLEELRRDLPAVPSRTDKQAAAMSEPADPYVVLDAINDPLLRSDGPARNS